jgi:hypothetical protein
VSARWTAILLVTATWGCDGESLGTGGSGEGGGSGDGGASSSAFSSASATSTTGPELWCPPPWRIIENASVPVTAEVDGEACLDSDAPTVIDVCVTDVSLPSPRYLCFGHRDSSQTAWIFALQDELQLDPAEWATCEEEARIPSPCFVHSCEQPYPMESTCSEAKTAESFGCGAVDAAYDDDCCRRPSCQDGACPTGFACATISVIDYMYCWAAESPDECFCGGLSGGSDEDLCFPE